MSFASALFCRFFVAAPSLAFACYGGALFRDRDSGVVGCKICIGFAGACAGFDWEVAADPDILAKG